MTSRNSQSRSPVWRRSSKSAPDTSSTHQLILSTARRLLIEHGYGALTFDTVAPELGCDKATIAYHFRNKMGLVTAVQDALANDLMASIVREVREAESAEEHVDTSSVAKALLIAGDARVGWLDVMPYAIRDPELRKIHTELYEATYRLMLEWFDLESFSPPLPQPVLKRFAAAAVAVTDGLAIQVGLQSIDLDEAALAMELVLDSTTACLTQGTST